MNKSINKGFTLMEVLVSTGLFVLILLVITSTYAMGQRIYKQSTNNNELWQNARSVMDRMTREIRQSIEIITLIPPTATDESNPPANELIFKNGHNSNEISYIRYYLLGTDIYREHSFYYFSTDPGTQVPIDSIDQFGNAPIKEVLENTFIGEFFSNLAFWGSDVMVNIAATLQKSDQSIDVFTSVFGRNL